MGDGLYTAFVWGAVRPDPEGSSEMDGDEWYDLVHAEDGDLNGTEAGPVQARTRYEADLDWFGFVVADSGRLIPHEQEVPPMGEFARTVLPTGTVLPIGDLPWEVANRWPERLKACQAAYERLHKRAAARGVTLPTGRLMLVSDFV